MPSSPGVYWFTDAAANILYVGKAKSLKHRLRSYTQITRHHPRTHKLVHLARAVHFKILSSELEAILTEAELIKLHQPPFNILLKDDKSPLYLILTTEAYPRLLPVRKKTLTTSYTHLPARNIFGPFSSGLTAKRIVKLARRTFRFCTASPTQKKHRRPCFYTHLGLCSGACAGWISPEDYADMIGHLRLFLRGRKKTLLKNLKTHMRSYSDQKLYEQAQAARDQIFALEELYSPELNHSLDLSLPVIEADRGTARMAVLRKILHDTGFVSASYPLTRLEAYDISNTQGTNATASMVVFTSGQPDLDEYRHFRIRYTQSGGDPAMIKEVLARRLNHPEWPYPNLFIIDGGRTQLKAALAILGTSHPTVSIVKHPDRLLIPKPPVGLKGPLTRQTKLNYISVTLKPGEPASSLIQHLRNEAHRFAKNYHQHLRTKSITNDWSTKAI